MLTVWSNAHSVSNTSTLSNILITLLCRKATEITSGLSTDYS